MHQKHTETACAQIWRLVHWLLLVSDTLFSRFVFISTSVNKYERIKKNEIDTVIAQNYHFFFFHKCFRHFYIVCVLRVSCFLCSMCDRYSFVIFMLFNVFFKNFVLYKTCLLCFEYCVVFWQHRNYRFQTEPSDKVH